MAIRLSDHRRLEPVIDAVDPVGGRDRDHQLHDLLLTQVAVEGVQVTLVDISRSGREKVREPENGPLLRAEDLRVSPPRLFERTDLLLGESSPLARSGVGDCSVRAPVQDGDPKVGQLLELLGQLAHP
jgi:hypothetical protein